MIQKQQYRRNYEISLENQGMTGMIRIGTAHFDEHERIHLAEDHSESVMIPGQSTDLFIENVNGTLLLGYGLEFGNDSMYRRFPLNGSGEDHTPFLSDPFGQPNGLQSIDWANEISFRENRRSLFITPSFLKNQCTYHQRRRVFREGSTGYGYVISESGIQRIPAPTFEIPEKAGMDEKSLDNCQEQTGIQLSM